MSAVCHYLPNIQKKPLNCPVCVVYRLGEVTLRDFKAAVDRQGSFRYHFKALDPEFGTVKEEVSV